MLSPSPPPTTPQGATFRRLLPDPDRRQPACPANFRCLALATCERWHGARDTCTICRAGQLVDDSTAGDVVCTSCGTVALSRVCDVTAEWRSFVERGSGADPNRVGLARTDGNGTELVLGTKIGAIAAGADVPGWMQHRDGGGGLSAGGRAAVAEIAAICGRASLGERAKVEAERLYHASRAHPAKPLRSTASTVLAAACTFIAARTLGRDRTYKELAAATSGRDQTSTLRGTAHKDVRTLQRTVKRLAEVLEVEMAPPTPGALAARFAFHAGLPPAVFQCARAACDRATAGLGHGVAGRHPGSVAAAVLLLLIDAAGRIGEPWAAAAGRDGLEGLALASGQAQSTIFAAFTALRPHAAALFEGTRHAPLPPPPVKLEVKPVPAGDTGAAATPPPPPSDEEAKLAREVTRARGLLVRAARLPDGGAKMQAHLARTEAALAAARARADR